VDHRARHHSARGRVLRDTSVGGRASNVVVADARAGARPAKGSWPLILSLPKSLGLRKHFLRGRSSCQNPVVAAAVNGIGVLIANNSSKPTPLRGAA